MTRYAVVRDGVVHNVCEGEGSFQIPGATVVELPQGSRVGRGWLYNGGTFSPAEPVEERARFDCAMYQLKLELHQRGRLSDVVAAIAALNEPKRTRAQLRWDNAAPVEIGDVVSDVIAATLALNRKNLELLFAAAAKN